MSSVEATGAARVPDRKIRSGMPTLPARCASPSRDMGFHIVGEDEDIVFIKLLGHVGLPAGDSHLSWRFRGEFGWNVETCQKEWAWVKSKSRIVACRAVKSQAGEAAPARWASILRMRSLCLFRPAFASRPCPETVGRRFRISSRRRFGDRHSRLTRSVRPA